MIHDVYTLNEGQYYMLLASKQLHVHEQMINTNN